MVIDLVKSRLFEPVEATGISSLFFLQDPSVMMHSFLTSNRQLTLGAHKHQTDFEAKETKIISQLEEAKEKIHQEIHEMKERLRASRENIKNFKDAIKALEHDQDMIT